MLFFKLLEKLVEKRIYHCFQYQDLSHYFNLAVEDCYGKRHDWHSQDLSNIERELNIMWGHLLKETKHVVPTVKVEPIKKSMPVPTGMPLPSGV